MRHEQILDKSSYDEVVVPAVWPASSVAAPPPAAEFAANDQNADFAPTPAAPDVPAAVGAMIAAAYAALIAAFAIATVGSAESIYAVTISALFVVTFFSVPRIFLGVEPSHAGRATFRRFMRDGLQTLTGHSTAAATLVQMLIVPVLLTFAALAMGVAAAIIM